MRVQIDKANGKCVVRAGPIARGDPDTEVHIVKSTGPGDKDWERVARQYIEGKKKMEFDLEPGEYHVMLIGDKSAGVVTTAGNVVPFPFDVFLDTPEEHAKDFMRVDLPTNVPVTGDLERSIKAALKD